MFGLDYIFFTQFEFYTVLLLTIFFLQMKFKQYEEEVWSMFDQDNIFFSQLEFTMILFYWLYVPNEVQTI